MPRATAPWGYFLLALAVLIAVIQASSDNDRDLTMVIWSLLVTGAVFALAEREQGD